MNEYTYNLTVGEKGIVEFKTEVIMGELKCLILDCERPSEVEIVSAMNPGLKIARFHNIVGNKYYIIKRQVVNYDGELFNYQTGCICLNEALNIKVEGMKDTMVKVVLRVD